MTRTITRYSSRKLYDAEESRYVSLEELADWVRSGEEIQVIDKGTGADVTAQTLTQVILEEGRNGKSLPSALMHELVRRGESLWHTGVEQMQSGVDRLMQASIEKVAPVRKAREEMDDLKERLAELESTIADLAEPAKKTVDKKTASKRTASKKTASKKTTTRRSTRKTTKSARG